MKRLTLPELLKDADPENHDTLRDKLRQGYGLAAYRNEDLGSYDVGRRVYLTFGKPDSTFQDPPNHAPDAPAWGLGWRYRLEGVIEPGVYP